MAKLPLLSWECYRGNISNVEAAAEAKIILLALKHASSANCGRVQVECDAHAQGIVKALMSTSGSYACLTALGSLRNYVAPVFSCSISWILHMLNIASFVKYVHQILNNNNIKIKIDNKLKKKPIDYSP